MQCGAMIPKQFPEPTCLPISDPSIALSGTPFFRVIEKYFVLLQSIRLPWRWYNNWILFFACTIRQLYDNSALCPRMYCCSILFCVGIWLWIWLLLRRPRWHPYCHRSNMDTWLCNKLTTYKKKYKQFTTLVTCANWQRMVNKLSTKIRNKRY